MLKKKDFSNRKYKKPSGDRQLLLTDSLNSGSNFETK